MVPFVKKPAATNSRFGSRGWLVWKLFSAGCLSLSHFTSTFRRSALPVKEEAVRKGEVKEGVRGNRHLFLSKTETSANYRQPYKNLSRKNIGFPGTARFWRAGAAALAFGIARRNRPNSSTQDACGPRPSKLNSQILRNMTDPDPETARS